MIKTIENFLSPELSEEILKCIPSAVSEDKAYAGKSVALPDSITGQILRKLISSDVIFTRLLLARLRITTESDQSDFRSFIHTDQDCRKVVVVYVENTLFENDDDAGTLFWEHRVTKANMLGEKNSRSRFLHSMILERDSSQLENWNNWLSTPFRKEAAIVFDSLYFHSPPLPSSPRKKGRRVTLDIFLD